MSDTGMDLITNRIMELEMEFFGDIGVEAERSETSVEREAEPWPPKINSSLKPKPKQGKKPKKCNVCGTEDPTQFYPYMANKCKKCHTDREAERKRKARAIKKNVPCQMTIDRIPLTQRSPVPHQQSHKTIKERCAMEVQAAGPTGIFQRDLRDKLGIDKHACRVAVKELVDSGQVVRTDELSVTGSPKLIWKDT